MIDIYDTRRGRNYRCQYWKRDVSGVMDNEQLIHKLSPNGVFYAKIVSSKNKDAQDVANAFRIGYQTISIETDDDINIQKDDLVLFDNEIWIVNRISTELLQKNAEFLRRPSTKTTLELNKG